MYRGTYSTKYGNKTAWDANTREYGTKLLTHPICVDIKPPMSGPTIIPTPYESDNCPSAATRFPSTAKSVTAICPPCKHKSCKS